MQKVSGWTVLSDWPQTRSLPCHIPTTAVLSARGLPYAWQEVCVLETRSAATGVCPVVTC